MPDGDYVVARSVDAQKQFLEPPPPEREFLISPPGSPPVGWEPRPEDGPNKETLALDLIEALQKLVEPMPEVDTPAPSEMGSVVVVEPNANEALYPGIIVHHSDEPESQAAPSVPISSVKATVESLQGRPPPTARPPM